MLRVRLRWSETFGLEHEAPNQMLCRCSDDLTGPRPETCWLSRGSCAQRARAKSPTIEADPEIAATGGGTRFGVRGMHGVGGGGEGGRFRGIYRT